MKNSEETTDNVVVTNIAFGPPEEVSEDLENAGIITTPEIEEKRAELAKIEEQLKNPGKSLTKLNKAKQKAERELACLEGKAATNVMLPFASKYPPDEWKTDDHTGLPVDQACNYAICAHEIVGLRQDDDSGMKIITKPVPWNRPAGIYWTDGDRDQFMVYLQNHGFTKVSLPELKTGINSCATEHHFSPMAEYMNTLPKWDGVKRVEGLPTKVLNVKNIPYTEIDGTEHHYADELLIMTCVAAYLKATGQKVDWQLMILILGAQGRGKSTFLRRLSGMDQFFVDNVTFRDFYTNARDAVEKYRGCFFCEIQEFTFSGKREQFEQIKAVITGFQDKNRFAYKENTSVLDRKTIFWGTSNEDTRSIFPDDTGNRRFPIWECEDGEPEVVAAEYMTPEFVRQFWAEIKECFVEAYRNKLALIKGTELYNIVMNYSKYHLMTDGKEDLVARAISIPLPDHWEALSVDERKKYIQEPSLAKIDKNTKRRTQISAMEVWCECLGGKDTEYNYRTNGKDITRIMIKLGLKRIPCPPGKKLAVQGYARQSLVWEIPAEAYKKGGVFEFEKSMFPTESTAMKDDLLKKAFDKVDTVKQALEVKAEVFRKNAEDAEHFLVDLQNDPRMPEELKLKISCYRRAVYRTPEEIKEEEEETKIENLVF